MKTTVLRSAFIAMMAVCFAAAVQAKAVTPTLAADTNKMDKMSHGKMDKMSHKKMDKMSKMEHKKMDKMSHDKMSHGKMAKDSSKM